MQAGLDGAAQRARVGLGVELLQPLPLRWGEDVGGEQPGERRLGRIPLPPDAGPVARLLDQVQDRLEQVVVGPQLVVQRVQVASQPGRVAQRGPDRHARGGRHQGGSGIKKLTYSASGGQTIPNTTANGPDATVRITAQGETTVTFFAEDVAGNVEAPKTLVVKLDRTPPTLTCSLTPSNLWPPNHRLETLTASVTVADPLSGSIGFALTSVTSSQAGARLDPDDVPNDIQGWDLNTPDTSGQLRAERAEAIKEGHVYTLTYKVTDNAGNAATCSPTVTVPHDQAR